jgi:hypothetical protein
MGYFTVPTRAPEDCGIGYLRRTVTFNQTDRGGLAVGSGNGIPIGALEAGTIPLYAFVTVETAFNAGTTNVLNLGTVDAAAGFAASASVIPGTTGFKGNLSGTLTGIPLAADKVVYASFTQTGTAATAGKAEIVLMFANKREGEGIPFPNN